MTDFVRISLSNGHEATVSRDYAQSAGLEMLDAPATNSRGVPLPAARKGGRRLKPTTTVSKEAAKKKAAKKSDSGPSDATTNDGVAVEPEEATK